MTNEISKQQEDINRQIDEAYTHLDELETKEAEINDALSKVNGQRARYTVLSEISDRLEKLEKLGGTALFWGDEANLDTVHQEQDRIHQLVIDYDNKVEALQQQKTKQQKTLAAVTAKINLLNDDTLNLQMRQDALAEEFVIEREREYLPYQAIQMPWNGSDNDQKRFRRILLLVLLFSIGLGVLIPMWHIPVPDRIVKAEIPERLAKLIVAQKQKPKPKPAPKKPEEKKVKDKTKKTKKKQPAKAKKSTKVAERAGIMAFKDDFADLLDTMPSAKLGKKAKISGSKGSKARKNTRSILTSKNGTAGSGGINVASLSRNVGGSGKGIKGVKFSHVKSAIGKDLKGKDRPLSDGVGPSRTDEEIQIVFDRYKSVLYRIYNKELRKNPTLQGKMVLRITIKPDGSVSACKVDSSDMDSATLNQKIVARVKRFNFGAKSKVPTITIRYPIDFLPAS